MGRLNRSATLEQRVRASSATSSLLMPSSATNKNINGTTGNSHESDVAKIDKQQPGAELNRKKQQLLQVDDEDDHTSGISSSSNNNGDEDYDEDEEDVVDVDDEDDDDEDRQTEATDEVDEHEEEEEEPNQRSRLLRRSGRRSASTLGDATATADTTNPNNNDKSNEKSRPKRRATNTHIFRYLQTRNPSRLEEIDLRRALEASLEDCPGDFLWPVEDSASCCGSSDQCNGCNCGTPKSSVSSSELSSSASSSASTSSSTGVKLTATTKNTSLNSSCRLNKQSLSSNNNNRRRRCSTSCNHHHNPSQQRLMLNKIANIGKRRRSSSSKANTMQRNHLCQYHNNIIHNIHSCNQHCHSSTMHHQNNAHTANPNCCPLSTSVQSRYKPVAKKTIYHEADFFHEGIMEYIEYVLLNSQGSR